MDIKNAWGESLLLKPEEGTSISSLGIKGQLDVCFSGNDNSTPSIAQPGSCAFDTLLALLAHSFPTSSSEGCGSSSSDVLLGDVDVVYTSRMGLRRALGQEKVWFASVGLPSMHRLLQCNSHS
jgi:hypothetical protein